MISIISRTRADLINRSSPAYKLNTRLCERRQIFSLVVSLLVCFLFTYPHSNKTFEQILTTPIVVDTKFFSVPSTVSREGIDFMKNWNGFRGIKRHGPTAKLEVKYMKTLNEFKKFTMNSSKCASALDVLDWLMGEMAVQGRVLVLAYGDLIHFHRDGGIINTTTGRYFDDDIDLWAYSDALTSILLLEPHMFRSFGWSVRIIVSGKHIVFAQLLSVCEHKRMEGAISKVVANQEPGIELYPVVEVSLGNGRFVKDLWQNTRLSESMILPTRQASVTAFGRVHQLYLPNKSQDIISCLYGNWTYPAATRAGVDKMCTTTS